MNYFISMFIDNELGLREKIEFLKKIRGDDGTYEESLALLEQEQMIRSDLDPVMPVPEFAAKPVEKTPVEKKRRRFRLPTLQPFGVFASAGAMAVAVALLLMFNVHAKSMDTVSHPFCLYAPDANTVEISGSFTNWQVLPLKNKGAGYWEIELDIPKGEHRYSYILDKAQRIADPTVVAKESDDFGGENSIAVFMSV
jgi:hypothetical protein